MLGNRRPTQVLVLVVVLCTAALGVSSSETDSLQTLATKPHKFIANAAMHIRMAKTSNGHRESRALKPNTTCMRSADAYEQFLKNGGNVTLICPAGCRGTEKWTHVHGSGWYFTMSSAPCSVAVMASVITGSGGLVTIRGAGYRKLTGKQWGHHLWSHVARETFAFARQPPRVIGVDPRVVDLSGDKTVDVFGQGFGFIDSHPRIRIGKTECPNAHWLSDSQVRCRVGPGFGQLLPVSVSVQQSSHQRVDAVPRNVFSYRAAYVNKVEPFAVRLYDKGQVVRLRISGFNLGTAQTWRAKRAWLSIGGRLCSSVHFISDEHLICKLVVGAQQLVYPVWEVHIQVAGVNGGSSAHVRVFTPSPTHLPTQVPTRIPTPSPTYTPSVSPSIATAVPTVPPTAEPSAEPTLAPSRTPTLSPTLPPSAKPSAVPTPSPSAIPSLAPTPRPSHIPSLPPSHTPTYHPTHTPTKKGVVLRVVPMSGPVTGHTSITLHGTNLAQDGIVTFGDGLCHHVRVVSSSKIVCTRPEALAGRLKVTVWQDCHQDTLSKLDRLLHDSPYTKRQTGVMMAKLRKKTRSCHDSVVYNVYRPRIDHIMPAGGPAVGGFRITIKGVHFGKAVPKLHRSNLLGIDGEVRVNKQPCKNLDRPSHHELHCDVPHGLPGFADIAVTIAGQTVVKRKALQLFKPMIESVRPNILSIFGGHVVDIVGKDLGYRGMPLPRVHFGAVPCHKVEWLSGKLAALGNGTSKLRCWLPRAVKPVAEGRVAVHVDGLPSGMSAAQADAVNFACTNTSQLYDTSHTNWNGLCAPDLCTYRGIDGMTAHFRFSTTEKHLKLPPEAASFIVPIAIDDHYSVPIERYQIDVKFNGQQTGFNQRLSHMAPGLAHSDLATGGQYMGRLNSFFTLKIPLTKEMLENVMGPDDGDWNTVSIKVHCQGGAFYGGAENDGMEGPDLSNFVVFKAAKFETYCSSELYEKMEST